MIYAQNLTVDFPIYGMTENRSFKKSLINIATGGVLAQDAGRNVIVRALDDLSFVFKSGDRIGLTGNNGSGKSTLLQVLAGIYEPTGGKLQVNGRISSMLGITLGMDNESSGYNNIFLRGRIMGLEKEQIEQMVGGIVDFAGIGDFIHLPLRTYSTGMLMRLAFAVATSVDADIILMDEWLSVGDADFLGKAKDRLKNMVEKASLVVIASHDHNLINDQCNIVMNLQQGKIISVIRK
jgi:lipopolysaccharide transport system ATP-binding protein